MGETLLTDIISTLNRPMPSLAERSLRVLGTGPRYDLKEEHADVAKLHSHAFQLGVQDVSLDEALTDFGPKISKHQKTVYSKLFTRAKDKYKGLFDLAEKVRDAGEGGTQKYAAAIDAIPKEQRNAFVEMFRIGPETWNFRHGEAKLGVSIRRGAERLFRKGVRFTQEFAPPPEWADNFKFRDAVEDARISREPISGETWAEQALYDVADMAPMVGGFLAAGVFAPAAAGPISLFAMGGVETIGYLDQMRAQGIPDEKAKPVALAAGMLAGAVEVAKLGQITNIGAKALKKSGIFRQFVSRALRGLSALAKETGEEFVQAEIGLLATEALKDQSPEDFKRNLVKGTADILETMPRVARALGVLTIVGHAGRAPPVQAPSIKQLTEGEIRFRDAIESGREIGELILEEPGVDVEALLQKRPTVMTKEEIQEAITSLEEVVADETVPEARRELAAERLGPLQSDLRGVEQLEAEEGLEPEARTAAVNEMVNLGQEIMEEQGLTAETAAAEAQEPLTTKEAEKIHDRIVSIIKAAVDKAPSQADIKYLQDVAVRYGPEEIGGDAWRALQGFVKSHALGTPVKGEAFGARNRIVSIERADKLAEEIRSKIGRPQFGVDPTDFPRIAQLGLFYFEGGVREFSAWSAEMVKKVGKGVEAHLRTIWDGIAVSRQRIEKGEVFEAPEEFDEKEAMIPAIKDLYSRNLANPATDADARALVEVFQDIKGEKTWIEVRHDIDVKNEAIDRLEADYQGEVDNILSAAPEGRTLGDTETAIAKTVINKEASEAFRSRNVDQITKAQAIYNSYRVAGTEQARGLRQRFDPVETPNARLKRRVIEGMLGPPKRQQAQIDKAKKRGDTRAEAFHKREWSKTVAKTLAALKEQGIDLANIDVLGQDPMALHTALRAFRTESTGLADWAFEFWSQNILSSWKTHVTNLLSTATYGIWHTIVPRGIEALVNLKIKDPKLAQFSEFQPIINAFLPGMVRAARLALLSFQTEVPQFAGLLGKAGMVKYETANVAIKGRFGRLWRMMGWRALTMEDEFMKSLFGQMNVAAIAHRKGKAKGFKGKQLEAYIQEQSVPPIERAYDKARELAEDPAQVERLAGAILSTMDVSTWEDTLELVRHITFQEENIVAEKISGLRGRIPGARYGLPFLKTPTNLFKLALKMSPFATPFAVADVMEAMETGNWKNVSRDVALNLTGYAMLLLVLATNDEEKPWLTGAEPAAVTARRQLAYRTGRKANSFRLGNRWYTYERIEPFSTIMAGMVDVSNVVQDWSKGKQGAGKAAKRLWASGVSQFHNKTFLRGASELFSIFEESPNESTVARFISNFASSWIPNLVRTIGRATKTEFPERRVWGDGPGWWQSIYKRFIQKLELGLIPDEPIIDLWGEIARKPQGMSYVTDVIERSISPIAWHDEKIEDRDLAVVRWNAEHPDDLFEYAPPQRHYTYLGEKKWMTDKQYRRYSQKAGRIAQEYAEFAVPDPQSPSEDNMDALKSALSKGRELARNALVKEWHEGIPSDLTVQQASEFIKDSQFKGAYSAIAAAKPTNLTTHDKKYGESLIQKQFAWKRRRDKGIQWFKEQGYTSTSAEAESVELGFEQKLSELERRATPSLPRSVRALRVLRRELPRQ